MIKSKLMKLRKKFFCRKKNRKYIGTESLDEIFEHLDEYDENEWKKVDARLKEEYEKDSKYYDFSIPEDWDRDFRAAMEEGFEKKRKKDRMVRRIAMCTAALVIVTTGTTYYQSSAQGQTMVQLFKSNFKKVFGIENSDYNSKTDIEIDINDLNQTTFYYTGNTLEEVNQKIEHHFKRPFFRIEKCMEEYTINNVSYNINTKLLIFEIGTTEGKVFIMQEERLNNTDAMYNHKNELQRVWNPNLNEEIVIYGSESDDGVFFSTLKDNIIFRMSGTVSLETCVRIAKNVYYK